MLATTGGVADASTITQTQAFRGLCGVGPFETVEEADGVS